MKEAVTKIWKEELGGIEFTPDDDFFELGGHSAIMIRIQARLLEQQGLAIPMDELFRHSTVAALSGYLEANKSQLSVQAGSPA